MVDLSHRRQPALSLALFTQRMLGNVLRADLAPRTPVAFVDLRVTLVATVVGIGFLGVGFAVALVCEGWASRPSARSLRSVWHGTVLAQRQSPSNQTGYWGSG
ncbi:hypothetical protein [Canibacter zhuwentaonis]|uniref:hypothetical protein n=1 Tax=Canibacter zhuwentaonis TaxID=2837491 RepID=UPI003F7ACF9A